VLRITGTPACDILVTTAEEAEGARQFLAKENVPFDYIRVKAS
jgi:hypothetical protein